MPEKENFNQHHEDDPKKGGVDILDLLSHLENITEDDIFNFRNEKIIHTYQRVFDKTTDENKIIFTAIYNLSPDNLEGLKKLAKKNVYIPGYHNIKSKLDLLKIWTEDPKF